MIKIEEDRQFLQDQREIRKMVMTTVDKRLTQKQERSLKRELEEENRRLKSQLSEPVQSTSKKSPSVCESLLELVDSSQTSSSEDEEYTPISISSKKKVKYSKATEAEADVEHSGPVKTTTKKRLFTSQVTSALDRNKVSDREALRLMVPIAAALGENPSALSISRTTIQRARKKGREDFAKHIKETFKPEFPLLVHWDGKILPEIIGSEKIDRLPIVVSGGGQEKLLAVPKLASGTGENSAKAIFTTLQEWNIVDKVQGMCFDTTSVNSGQSKGACALLEEMFGRELLWFPCRHHIMEIILSKVFSLCLGPSSAPDIQLFKRFKTNWNGIERDNFQGLTTDPEAECFKNDTVEYLLQVHKWQTQPRDDYKELIELTLAILGTPPPKMHWRAPGPVHHARWMAKLIYAMKIYLFRHQKDAFSLTPREEAQLKRFVTFGALLYTNAWIKAPLALEAPLNDLKLWLDLKKYEVIDEDISKAALKVLERHLWYISEEVVALAIFCDKVTSAEKKDMVKKMKSVPASTRMVRGNPDLVRQMAEADPKLSRFVSSRTKGFFQKLSIKTSFLDLEPDTWKENADFTDGLAKVKNLLVVNDAAERCVKMFEDFNKILTKSEEDKQFLLQVIEANRKAIPTQTTKLTAVGGLDAFQDLQ